MTKRKIPLSESTEKFKDWTAEQCITHLQGIAEAHPEQVITRNFFRNNSDISEATWNRYFGTFAEYKKQAGIMLSRHQHRMELDVAKHASLDAFREMNVDKAGWEESYLRPDTKRYQAVLVGTDTHDIECDPFWRHTFLDTARRVQPEKVVLNGDIFDLREFSRFPVDPREWDVVGRIKWVHEFLHDLREACPDAELILVEGNHEYRLLRHLAEASPAMRAVLSDLHGFTVPGLLGLRQFEVNYVARADLGTFRQTDIRNELKLNWIKLYDCLVGHHFPEGRRLGYPGWNGHHHKHLVWPSFSPSFGSFEWHQIGCGHARLASYTDGSVWANGFLLAHVDTHKKTTAFEYIQLQDHTVIGGKWYERQTT